MFFNIVKDLFKSYDVLRRSGKVQLSSNGKRISVPGGLRKKYLARCQILRSKYYLYTVYQKVFFNIVKDLFKSYDVLRRSGKVQLSSIGKRIFVPGGLGKKYSERCQILSSKYYLYTVYQKVFFNKVKDLFKSYDVLRRSGKVQLSSIGKRIFVPGGLGKKYSERCQILSSKYYLYTVYQKVFFNKVKDLFKSYDVLRRSGKVQLSSSGNRIFVPGGLRKKYSERCQILSSNCYLYTVYQKVFFNIVKDLFKSYDVLRRSGKVQLSSIGKRIFVPGGLRKKYSERCQILSSKYYLYTVYQKVFFNKVKDLFKSYDVLRRSRKIQLSSNGNRIFVPGGLRKKYLARCQILRSKYYLYTVYQKVFFNIVKDLFKSYDVLRRSGKVQLSSIGKRIFVPGGLRKKYSERCQILSSKCYLYTVYQKVFFNIVKDSFKSCDVLRRSGKVQLSSIGKRIFVPGGLRKKYSERCQFLSSKCYLYTVYQKVFFNIVKDSFKSCDVLRRSGKVHLSSIGRKIFVPGGLRKKCSERCQILSSKCYLYTVYQKVFFNIVKDLFKSYDVLRRSGKVQLKSNGKRISVPGALRKKYLARCQILR